MDRRYLLDTNICIYIINRRPGYERLLDRVGQHQYGEILVSAITLAELRFGVAKSQSRRRAENEKMLDLFLGRFPVMDFGDYCTASMISISFLSSSLTRSESSIPLASAFLAR